MLLAACYHEVPQVEDYLVDTSSRSSSVASHTAQCLFLLAINCDKLAPEFPDIVMHNKIIQRVYTLLLTIEYASMLD